jgi:hypothetical protein
MGEPFRPPDPSGSFFALRMTSVQSLRGLSSLTIFRDRRAVSGRIAPPPELVFALFRHHLDTQPPQTRAAGVKGEAA